MDNFSGIYEKAIVQKGGKQQLEELLTMPASSEVLADTPDDRYLAEMTRCVFRAGFVWKVVENKWPDFERVFKKFNPKVNAHWSDEDLERFVSDASIIRNYRKIESIRANAQFVWRYADSHGGFGKFIADWPVDNMTELFQVLKKDGSRLGGHSAQFFLRFMGKDTFMFSKDVVRVLIDQRIVSKDPTSKRDLQAVQDAFNRWREESGRPLCQISRIMAASVG